MKNHQKQRVAILAIRSISHWYYPTYHSTPKYEIFDIRARFRRFYKKFKDCPEYQQFEEQLNENKNVLKHIEMDHRLYEDDALVIMNEDLMVCSMMPMIAIVSMRAIKKNMKHCRLNFVIALSLLL